VPTLYQNPKTLAIENVDKFQILRNEVTIKFENTEQSEVPFLRQGEIILR